MAHLAAQIMLFVVRKHELHVRKMSSKCRNYHRKSVSRASFEAFKRSHLQNFVSFAGLDIVGLVPPKKL